MLEVGIGGEEGWRVAKEKCLVCQFFSQPSLAQHKQTKNVNKNVGLPISLQAPISRMNESSLRETDAGERELRK